MSFRVLDNPVKVKLLFKLLLSFISPENLINSTF